MLKGKKKITHVCNPLKHYIPPAVTLWNSVLVHRVCSCVWYHSHNKYQSLP